MRIRTAKPFLSIAGILTCIILLSVASPAGARSSFNRSISLASQQWLLVEQMTNGTMLAALGIDRDENVGHVQEARDLFGRTLRGLRNGDAELGLVAATAPEVLNEITRIEAFWPRYDSTLQTIMATLRDSAEVDRSYVRDLLDIHMLIIESVDRTIDAFEQYSHGGDTHSILSTTLNGSGQLRNQSQLMLGEMLAIAYHDRETENRRKLGRTAREFERTLTGLMNGDPDLRLLPAPNADIGGELMKIEQLWVQVRPILEGISSGEIVDERSIATVSHVTHRMIEPLNTAVDLYERL